MTEELWFFGQIKKKKKVSDPYALGHTRKRSRGSWKSKRGKRFPRCLSKKFTNPLCCTPGSKSLHQKIVNESLAASLGM